MSSVEEIEMEKHRKELDSDILALLDKYLRAIEWDVPEADESRARKLVLNEIKQAIERVEAQARDAKSL